MRLSQVYRRSFVATLGALTAIVLLYALYAVHQVAMMFAVAGFLAYLLAGPIEWLTARFGRRRLFTVLVFVAFMFLMLGLLGSFVPIVATQIRDLIRALPEIVAQLELRFAALNESYGFTAPEARFSDYLRDFSDRLQAQPELLNRMLGYGRTVLGSAALAMVWAILVPLMALYILLDAGRLRRAVVILFLERHQPSIDEALTAVNRTLGGYIYSRVVLALFVWAAYTVLLIMMGVPYALLLGILAFVGEFIPVVGGWIAFVPIGLIVLVTVPDNFVWILLVVLLVQAVQNYVFAPKVMGDAMDIHPLTVVLGMLVGGTLAGPVGLLLAVPAVAATKAIYSVLWLRREELLSVDVSVVDLVCNGGDVSPDPEAE